jgi:hypothetical protein
LALVVAVPLLVSTSTTPPPRRGRARWMVASRPMAKSVRVEVGSVRCLPAKTKRRSSERRFVRRTRRERRVEMVVVGGTESGMAVFVEEKKKECES